jgi:hypothetical protein
MRSNKRKIWFELVDSINPTPVHFQPAAANIPQWYKNLNNYVGGSPIVEKGKVPNTTVKRCAPVYDAITFGYLAILHTDVFIEYTPKSNDEYELTYHYSVGPEPLRSREYSPEKSLKIDESFVPVEFVWLFRWTINTEPGSSVLITHPLNRLDLPFVTSSGVMDTDSGFTVRDVAACPFFLKKGFTGLIPAGTPMAQIIPFERHEYNAEIRDLPEVIKYRRLQKWAKHLSSGYRREYRKSKVFK